MNICFICSEYPPYKCGGIGNFVKSIAEKFVANGHRVKVIGLYNDLNQDLHESINGVKVTRLKKSNGRYRVIHDILMVRGIIDKWIKNNEIDLVEDNDWDCYSFLFMRLKCKITLRLHNPDLYNRNNSLKLSVLNWIKIKASSKNCDSIISVSNYTKNLFIDKFGFSIKTTTIHNGVALAKGFPPFENRVPNHVIFVGSLVKKKGVLELLKAWQIVLETLPSAKLNIYGKDGFLDLNLKASDYILSLPSKVRDSIAYYNHVTIEELYEVYRTASAFVAPSHNEAFALTPMESMANGCPTVFTKFLAGKELIDNNIDGVLINPTDIQEISNAIIKILTDIDFSKKLSYNGFRKIERLFDINKVYENNFKHYSEILNE